MHVELLRPTTQTPPPHKQPDLGSHLQHAVMPYLNIITTTIITTTTIHFFQYDLQSEVFVLFFCFLFVLFLFVLVF